MSKIVLVTGASGLIGSAMRGDIKLGRNIEMRSSNDVRDMIVTNKPNIIINCAGYKAGLGTTAKKAADFAYSNLLVNLNVLQYAKESEHVEKVISFMSIDGYETYKSVPDSRYETESYVNRMTDVLGKAFSKQYGLEHVTIVPPNVYGINDNYDLNDATFTAATIHRLYLAKKSGSNLIMWGDGKARRNFMYAKDLAKLTELIIDKYDRPYPFPLSDGIPVTTEQFVHTAAKIVGFNKRILFDKTKSSGRPDKLLTHEGVSGLDRNFKFTPLEEGLGQTIEWFNKNYEHIRK